MTTVRLHNFRDGIEVSAAVYGIVHHIEAAVIKLQKTLSTWASRAEDRRQLSVMSDRMLKDIGLTRVEVEYEVNKHFWQS